MEADTPLIPVGKARAELAELCSRVAYSGKRVVITRHGRPLVSIVPLDETPRPADIETSVTINSSLLTVWNALTSVRAPKWWEGLNIEPHTGGWVRDGSDDFGKVLEVDPGELIRTTWPGGRGTVTFALAEEGDTIVVTVTHHMEPEFWNSKLGDLKQSCEAQQR